MATVPWKYYKHESLQFDILGQTLIRFSRANLKCENRRIQYEALTMVQNNDQFVLKLEMPVRSGVTKKGDAFRHPPEKTGQLRSHPVVILPYVNHK